MKTLAVSAVIFALSIVPVVASSTVDEKNPSAKSYRVSCGDDIGSGFFVNNSSMFVTARHVVANCLPSKKITVHSSYGQVGSFIPDRESASADIVFGNVERDSKYSEYTFTSYDVNCSRPKLGDTVYSAGHALGLPKDTTQRAVVKRDPRPDWNKAHDVVIGTRFIEGMSGGPVTDAKSQAIGIVLWRYDDLKNVSGFGSIVPVCPYLRG